MSGRAVRHCPGNARTDQTRKAAALASATPSEVGHVGNVPDEIAAATLSIHTTAGGAGPGDPAGRHITGRVRTTRTRPIVPSLLGTLPLLGRSGRQEDRVVNKLLEVSGMPSVIAPIRWFQDLGLANVDVAGGKGANLGEL